MLCMALALVYAGALTSQLADQVQHSGTQTDHHDHLVFSDGWAMVGTDDHHADDADVEDTDTVQPDQPDAGGHHHHSDTGPSLIQPLADALPRFAYYAGMRAPPREQAVVGVAVPGPERPPKLAILTA